jgi:phosphoglycolate phosphatase
MIPSKPQALLFDWDNTLVDTWPIIHRALEQTFQEYGMQPWTLSEVKSRVKKSMRDAFPELFGDEWQKAGDMYIKHYRLLATQSISMLPDSEELLKYLLSQGTFVGIVSNKNGEQLRKEVDHLGWNHHFRTVIGSLDAERDKPYPDPALMALEGTDFNASDVWFIGDTEVDLQCAAACGFKAILYGDNHTGIKSGYDFHCENHQVLLELLS